MAARVVRAADLFTLSFAARLLRTTLPFEGVGLSESKPPHENLDSKAQIFEWRTWGVQPSGTSPTPSTSSQIGRHWTLKRTRARQDCASARAAGGHAFGLRPTACGLRPAAVQVGRAGA
eukprot:scaffold2737_cov229-Pinguiococcus_pyrenoidosus.AAC.3